MTFCCFCTLRDKEAEKQERKREKERKREREQAQDANGGAASEAKRRRPDEGASERDAKPQVWLWLAASTLHLLCTPLLQAPAVPQSARHLLWCSSSCEGNHSRVRCCSVSARIMSAISCQLADFAGPGEERWRRGASPGQSEGEGHRCDCASQWLGRARLAAAAHACPNHRQEAVAGVALVSVPWNCLWPFLLSFAALSVPQYACSAASCVAVEHTGHSRLHAMHARTRTCNSSPPLPQGRLYLKKATIVDVPEPTQCEVVVDDTGKHVSVREQQLETYIPKAPGTRVSQPSA
jgi:hypothetical protein